MPRIATQQTNFTSGELSPLMAARIDTSLYANGAEVLGDWALLAQGGVRTRPGLRYLHTFTATQAPCRLAPYEFNPSQAYVLAFADQHLTIFFTDGTVATELTGCPWTQAMLPELDWTWTGDTIIVVHPDMAPQLIKRTGASSFTRQDLAFEDSADGKQRYQPYQRYAPTGVTLTPSGTTGSITITASSPVFDASQVGDIIRIKSKEIEITAYTSATQVTGTVRDALVDAAATTDWDEQAFSSYRGWPKSVLFFDGRLWFGGARSKPSGIWASKVGAWFNFDVGTAKDDEAIWEEVAGARVSEVRHLVGHRHLQIFTDIAEYYVPSSEARPITPTSIAFRQQTAYGAGWAHPAPFDGATLFVDRNGKTVREFLFVDTEQAYRSDAVSLLSPHLIDSPAELAVLYGGQTFPEQYAFVVNADGSLAVFHSVRAERIAGWVPWRTQGAVRGLCVVAARVFAAVERTVGGNQVWFLEVFDDDLVVDAAREAPVSGGVAAGFDHLAGETVEVVSGDFYLGQQTVAADGTITLDALDPDVSEITAGLGYRPRMRPMPFDFLANDLAVRGRKKRIRRAVVTCDRSMSYAVDGDALLLDFVGDTLPAEAPTVTGDIEFRLLGWSERAQFDVEVVRPGKVTILGLTREVQVGG